MRICKIVGCKTNSSDKERGIFEYVKNRMNFTEFYSIFKYVFKFGDLLDYFDYFMLFYYILCRVNGKERQKWIPMIQKHQTLNLNQTIYICDLHFNPNDLYRHGDSLRPKKNVSPQFWYRYISDSFESSLFFQIFQMF